ncbi:MAG TPA: hypothetical protein VGL22_00435 [Terracidiphilus sp.]
MNTQAVLIEVLLAGFFAVACFKARSNASLDLRVAPRSLFVLTSRIERLRQSRLQWCSMVLLLFLVRMQQGTPLMAELTALAQFVLFMALPTAKRAMPALRAR